MDPTNRATILVHKEGEEGALHIDADTGIITTPIDDRPDWADGLASALPHERNRWYEQRLGPKYAADHKSPEAIAFQDLSWIGVDAEGDEVEIEADLDYRQQVLASVLGVDLEEGTFTEEARSHILAEVDLAVNPSRTPAEASAIDDELRKGFGKDTDTQNVKTGTE